MSAFDSLSGHFVFAPHMSGSQIAQVISNLVRNAVQAMQASEREQILWFRTKIQGSTAIVFELEDTGTGIDPAQLEKHIRARS